MGDQERDLHGGGKIVCCVWLIISACTLEIHSYKTIIKICLLLHSFVSMCTHVCLFLATIRQILLDYTNKHVIYTNQCGKNVIREHQRAVAAIFLLFCGLTTCYFCQCIWKLLCCFTNFIVLFLWKLLKFSLWNMEFWIIWICAPWLLVIHFGFRINYLLYLLRWELYFTLKALTGNNSDQLQRKSSCLDQAAGWPGLSGEDGVSHRDKKTELRTRSSK